MKINRVLVLVELENGKVHQVILTEKEKLGLLVVIEEKRGSIQLHEEPEEYTFGTPPPPPPPPIQSLPYRHN